MRVVVGINHETYAAALDLLVSLRLASTELVLVHVIESPFQDMPSIPFSPVREWFNAQEEEEGKRELEAAARRLEGSPYQVHSAVLRGDTPKVLIEQAKLASADLIAIGSSKKGHWGALFYGSVTKAVVAGAEQSVLVAKRGVRSEKGIHAVIATDHSDYFNKSVETLLRWNLSGIRSATVLTSIGQEGRHKVDLAQAFARLRSEVEKRNQDLCGRLQANGIESASIVADTSPQQAIDEAVKASRADLVILGAQGHGFWERVRLGSVSYYEVMDTDHNVLILRA